MIYYELTKRANQKFNTNIGDNNFEFDIHTSRGVLYMNVSINGELADVNAVGLPNQSLFNDLVNKTAGGVFMFKSLIEDYPSYEQFDGTTCKFVFVPYGE